MDPDPTDIDITTLDKADVLVALFNNSRQQGMGFLNASGAHPLPKKDAETLLKEQGERPYFDYVRGRVLKVDLSSNTLRTRLYDRDNGQGAAAAALKPLFDRVPA